MKQINWGIIGCGDVTEVKSGPAFNKVDGSRLVAVMRRNGKKAADYAQRHGVPRWYDKAGDLINDPDVNAIYVATPPDSHCDYAIMAMKAGKPVYVEKPMAASFQQCLEMNRVSEETGVALFVAYYRRTLPGFLKVKELIDQGTIGKPFMATIQFMRPALSVEKNQQSAWWRIDPSIGGGGLFYDLGSHQLDFLDYLFGGIGEVKGFVRNFGDFYEAEDTVVLSGAFENGVLLNGQWSFITDAASACDKMEIIGSKGRIRFSCFSHDPVELINSAGEIHFPYLNPENIQYNLIKQVVEELQGISHCVSTGKTAARTSKILEEVIYGSLNSK